MRLNCIALVLIYFILNSLWSQNLIQNSSFEDYSSCPIGSGQLWKASPWVGQSCELYNICAPANTTSSPYCNLFSFQTPNHGNGFAGFHPYLDSLVFGREIIYQKISSILLPNHWYCSSLFTNLADGSRYGIDCIEIYLSEDSLNYSLGFANLPIETQIKNKYGIISDTSNWIFVEGAFQANGNEKYFYIGCFALNNQVQKEWFNYSFFFGPPFNLTNLTYYFIDDVSLYELNKLPQAQNHAYNCAANTVTLRADTGFNFRWYYLPDTVNVLSTTDTFMVDASQERTVLLRATLCSTEFTDTLLVPKLDCTGLEGNALAQGANLFPNPASTHATLQLGGTPPPGSRLRLLDLHGRELRSMAILNQNTEVLLYSLPAGVYVAELVVNGQGIWRRKLCKFEE